MDTPFERMIKNLKKKFPRENIQILCKRTNKFSVDLFKTIFTDSVIYNLEYENSTLLISAYKMGTLYFALIDGTGIDIASMDVIIENKF